MVNTLLSEANLSPADSHVVNVSSLQGMNDADWLTYLCSSGILWFPPPPSSPNVTEVPGGLILGRIVGTAVGHDVDCQEVDDGGGDC